jgi:CIC family chloride channel protein
MVAATTHAPITAFLVIFELTGDYKLILPLMLCSILASFVASAIKKESIYTMKLARRGVDISKGMEASIMQSTKVKDVMNRDIEMLHENTGFNEFLKKVINSNKPYYYVVNDEREYQGSFNVHDVKEVLNEDSLAGLVVAKDLVSLSVSPSIGMDATLAECMRKFSIYEIEELPVIDSENPNKLVGEIGRRDIMNVYNHEILRQGSLGLKFIHGKIPDKSLTQSYVDLPDGFEINVIQVTKSMQDHSLKELDIRNNYAVTVVAINRRGDRGEREVIIPDSEEILNSKDMLVVVGEKAALKRLREAFNKPS